MEKFSKKNEILRSRGFDPGTIRLPVEDLTNRAIERLDSSPLRFPYILDTFDGFFKCSKVNFNPHCTHFSHLHSLWSGQPQVVARSILAGLEKKKITACRLPRFNQSAGLTPGSRFEIIAIDRAYRPAVIGTATRFDRQPPVERKCPVLTAPWVSSDIQMARWKVIESNFIMCRVKIQSYYFSFFFNVIPSFKLRFDHSVSVEKELFAQDTWI